MAATTVAEIMERDAPSIALEASIEDVVAQFKEQDVPMLPVVNEGGRCVGVVTEKDLVIVGEEGDLHIPHYIELFGGLVFFPPELRVFEKRNKGFNLIRIMEECQTRGRNPPDLLVGVLERCNVSRSRAGIVVAII